MRYRELLGLQEAYLQIYEENNEDNLVLDYLLDEGYAETPEAAEAIMGNMSEEWRQSIVEESRGEELRAKHGDNPSTKLSKKAFNAALNTPNRARFATGETGTDRKRSLLSLAGAAETRSKGEMPQGPRKIKSRGGAKPVIGSGENRDRGDKEKRLSDWASGRRSSPNMGDSERRLRHGR